MGRRPPKCALSQKTAHAKQADRAGTVSIMNMLTDKYMNIDMKMNMTMHINLGMNMKIETCEYQYEYESSDGYPHQF